MAYVTKIYPGKILTKKGVSATGGDDEGRLRRQRVRYGGMSVKLIFCPRIIEMRQFLAIMTNLFQAADKLSLNLWLFRPEALIMQITHKPSTDVRSMDARENTTLLG